MNEYKLPDVGEGLTEAEIVTWKVKVGDVIKVNDIVVEIETAKSLVELPSPYAGTIQALLVPEGETIPVGTPIIRIGDGADPSVGAEGDGGAAPQTEADPYLGLAQKAAPGRERDRHVQPGRDRRRGEPDPGRLRPARGGRQASSAARWGQPGLRRRRRGAAAAAGRVRARGVPRPPTWSRPRRPRCPRCPRRTPTPPAPTRVLAKPPVRKLAKDLGVDLLALTPTGPEGTVTREDVQAAPPAPPTPRAGPLCGSDARPAHGRPASRSRASAR